MRTLILITLLATGCKVVTEKEKPSVSAAAQSVQPAPSAPKPDSLTNLHFIVDISDRKLYVVNANDTLRVEDVAVGKASHPTPTGEWGIKRVDFNPDWVPPPGEEWTEDKEPQKPGAPKNPMGRARLVFHEPYTIHGTAAGKSLGSATSHGSIRIANATAMQLGRMVLEAGGAAKPDSFYQRVQADSMTMTQVAIPNPVPITVRK